MIHHKTHYRNGRGPLTHRVRYDEIPDLVYRTISSDGLLQRDVEAWMDHLATTVLFLPDVELDGDVHLAKNGVRPVPGQEDRYQVTVHFPTAWWPEFAEALGTQIYPHGDTQNHACTCRADKPHAAWILTTTVDPRDGKSVSLDQMLAELLTACDQLVKEIIAVYAPIAEQQREDSLAKLRSELTRRVEVVQTVNRVHEQLGISLSPAPAEQQVPLTPKALGAEAFHRRSAAGEPLPALVREAREGVISTIASFATALESLPETAGHLAEFGEEQLRDVLLFVLNANWRGQAAGEVFTNRGKTAISIFAADRRLFTAELKWWHGAKQLTAAIDQLAGYTIARDTAACLIMLSKAKNFTQMQYTAETTIAAHPHITGRIPTPDDKPARVQLRSSVDEGRMIELVFLPVCLTLPTT